MSNASSPAKILFVVWEFADWQLLHPLLDGGHLPNLNRLVERGVMVEPVTASGRALATGQTDDPTRLMTLPPVWQALGEHGRKCLVVRWPGTHPASAFRPKEGVCVSERFRAETLPVEAPEADSVEPASLVAGLADLRLHPGQLAADDVRAFVPNFDKLEPADQPPLQWLAGALADAATTQRIATHLMQNEPWDFAAIHCTAIGAICQRFMQFSVTGSNEGNPFRAVAGTVWALADQLLGRLVELAGEGATILVCSSQGVLGQPVAILDGPGVREDERLDVSAGPASVLDVVPTLRWVAGLPADPSMPGRAWTQAWAKGRPGEVAAAGV